MAVTVPAVRPGGPAGGREIGAADHDDRGGSEPGERERPERPGRPAASIPGALSADRAPGPVAASANAAAIRTRLYSKPPSVDQSPRLQWAVEIATSIVAITSKAPSGVE